MILVLLSKHADPERVKALQRQIHSLDPFNLSETIDKKLTAIQRLVAKAPAPKLTFHSNWGRKKISEIGAPPNTPTTSLSTWHIPFYCA